VTILRRALRPGEERQSADGRPPASSFSFFIVVALRYRQASKSGSLRERGVALAFGDHRLDISRRELRRGAKVIELEPKVFDLLTFLVLSRDRIVTKDDLLQGVWGGRIVSESALTTRINAVRRALGDDGTAERLVRTFTRKGVRFVGDVTEVSDPAAVVGDPPSWATAAADKPSIAVLPFQNMSADPEQEFFADGIAEDVITALSRYPSLFVIARSSCFTYRGRAVDVKEIGVSWAFAMCSKVVCANPATVSGSTPSWSRPRPAGMSGPTTTTAISPTSRGSGRNRAGGNGRHRACDRRCRVASRHAQAA
jgi:DNA-binding winged helix-turn-helix (wHTH) protein